MLVFRVEFAQFEHEFEEVLHFGRVFELHEVLNVHFYRVIGLGYHLLYFGQDIRVVRELQLARLVLFQIGLHFTH